MMLVKGSAILIKEENEIKCFKRVTAIPCNE